MGKHTQTLGFNSRAIHSGNQPDQKTGSVSPTIHLTSTFEQDAVGHDRGFDYSRAVNPTRSRLEENIAALEGGKQAITFSSGMAAVSTIFQLLSQGDHIIVSRNVYGGTYRVARRVFERQGIEFSFIDARDPATVEAAIRPETRIVFIESPTNPLLEIADIRKIAEICRRHKVTLAVDNTFMSPFGQRPLELGADLVLHSSTKFISGHSDIIGGVLITSDSSLAERLYFLQKSVGAIPSPFDCWVLLRSTKTLAVRVERQFENAAVLARYLANRLGAESVIYPGLKSHPQHSLAADQQIAPNGKPVFGSIISIDLGSITRRDSFLKEISLFTLAESLGGVESLISNPYEMTHGDVPVKEKLSMGIAPGLLRLSIGLEDVEDLQADLESALSRCF